jgi:hypothetical protein
VVSVRLISRRLEDHRRFELPARRDYPDVRLDRFEALVLKDLFGELPEGAGLGPWEPLSHDLHDVIAIKLMDVIDRMAEANQSGDNRTRARPKYDVEPLVQRAEQPFQPLQHSNGVKALCTPSIEAKNSARSIR